MTWDHLEIQHRAIPIGNHSAVVGELGFGDLDLTLQVIDLITALQGLGFDLEFHLLIAGDHLLLVDLDVINIHAGVREALLSGYHLTRQGRHDIAPAQPFEILELAGIGALQNLVALTVVAQLGQRCVNAGLFGHQPQGIPEIQLAVVTLQLGQVALLLLQFTVENRQVKAQHHVALLHPVSHFHRHILNLAGGPGIEEAGVVGIDQNAGPHNLRGHGPEQGPKHEHAPHASQANAHLIVVTEALPPLRPGLGPAPIPRGGLAVGGRHHGGQHAGSPAFCQPTEAPGCSPPLARLDAI